MTIQYSYTKQLIAKEVIFEELKEISFYLFTFGIFFRILNQKNKYRLKIKN
tara:strand:+ start:11319 stop:11471 length:153 start_codon:yes stop_codon:yes gene_type:complete